MVAMTETIGERIAREFSADKTHLFPSEQRRLAAMIDKQVAAPEMLDALRLCLEDAEQQMKADAPGVAPDWYSDVKAAIASAERMTPNNASTISADPDLLAACKESLQMMGHQHWDDTMQRGKGCKLCLKQFEIASRIRAAIAKAEGAIQ